MINIVDVNTFEHLNTVNHISFIDFRVFTEALNKRRLTSEEQ